MGQMNAFGLRGAPGSAASLKIAVLVLPALMPSLSERRRCIWYHAGRGCRSGRMGAKKGTKQWNETGVERADSGTKRDLLWRCCKK